MIAYSIGRFKENLNVLTEWFLCGKRNSYGEKEKSLTVVTAEIYTRI